MTLRINTSRCERTRSHFLNSIRAGERQCGISGDNGIYYSFTLWPAQSGKPGSISHFAGLCADGITGLHLTGKRGKPAAFVNAFLTLSAVTK
ncbi:hypothetical protein ACFIOY_38370 [Bradyrhizobium sp. TZ2]